MKKNEIIKEIIRDCIELVNDERPENNKILINDQTLIMAPNTQFDSLEFIYFLTNVESMLSDSFHVSFSNLFELDLDSISNDASPFINVSTLEAFIYKTLNNH